jgi:hypothetical protein
MLYSVAPPLLVALFPVYVYVEGVKVASLHTLLVCVWAMLLTNICLIHFRKLPFTCTFPLFKQHSIVILIAFCFGFLVFTTSTAEFESEALRQPVQMLGAFPVVWVAWFIPRYLGKSTIALEKRLIFEESATRTVEGLRLSE